VLQYKHNTWILGQVSVPNPLTLVISHFVGTWPQFNRHDISGIGTPTALHVVMNTSPISSVIKGGGVVWNCTGTILKLKKR